MGTCCSKESATYKSISSSQSNIHPELVEEGDSPRQPPSHCQTDDDHVSEMNPVIELPQPTRTPLPLVTIVFAPLDRSNPSPCAYCDNPVGDLHDYFHVLSSLSHELLEEFMENGWWRTGQLLFRPRFDIVCCPGYATRLPVSKYVLTKKHRRVIRKWAEFLKKGDPQWERRGDILSSLSSVQKVEEVSQDIPKKRTKGPVKPGVGPDPTKAPCKKAKERRAEHSRTKNKASDSPSTASAQVSLVNFIDQEITQCQNLLTGLKHRFEFKLLSCAPMDPLLRATIPQAYKLYDKLQRTVHQGKTRFDSEEQFKLGFCSSCLANSKSHEPPQGSYHLQYYLDHEVVMYSIVDITPHYFVSVYFVYDPDLRFISPGIFTCLYEMALVQKLKQTLPTLEYYGLGYYNHFDDKSSYKRQFKPQQVLCNETNVFVNLESAIPKFAEKKYCRLADDSIPEKEGRTASIDVICVSKRRCNLGSFDALPETEKDRYRASLKQFVAEAGSSAAQKCCVDLVANFGS